VSGAETLMKGRGAKRDASMSLGGFGFRPVRAALPGFRAVTGSRRRRCEIGTTLTFRC